MGNKQAEKLIATGNIPSVVCNNQSNQKVGILMKEVALVPDCTFNVFGTSKQLKQGWKLGSNSNPLILTSPDGKFNVKFNITILMPNGKLYAVCIMCTPEEMAAVVTANHSFEKNVKLTMQ